MKGKGASNQTRAMFIERVLAEIKTRAEGSNSDRIDGDKPSKRLFIGNLSPKKDMSVVSSVVTKTSPSSMGLEVLIRKTDVKHAIILIKPGAAFYYRVFPELAEQQELRRSRQRGDDLACMGSNDERFSGETDEAEESGNRMRTMYQKIKPEPPLIKAFLADLAKTGKGRLAEIDTLTDAAYTIYNNDPKKFRYRTYIGKTKREKDAELIVPDSALINEETYNAYLNEWGAKKAIPSWKADLKYKVSDFNDECIKLSVVLENDFKEGREEFAVDNSLFESKLSISIGEAEFQPYVLDYLKDDYKYDGNIYANGINCSIERISSTEIRTEHLPVFRQNKYKSQEYIELSFKKLSDDPFPILSHILSIMECALSSLEAEFKVRDLTEKGKLQFQDDINCFKLEIERFKNGIKVLKNDRKAHEAFTLMNSSFLNSGKDYHNWRLFQLVFILMEIPDITRAQDAVSRNYAEDVDVIYFPTGGGKTEAYLSAVVFAIFYDRLRGKRGGVTAITRFPLRLLSLQQLQRIADIFGQAELLRRKHPIIGQAGFESFSTGYFVGEHNTPNKVYQGANGYSEKIDRISPINEDPGQAEKFKIISKCPFCNQDSVKIVGDLERLRILHICTNEDCREEIPVYISDEEIYRYLPTFIVSTLDKMATAGWQKLFKNIFGRPDGRCPKHGYFSGDSCIYKKTKYSLPDPHLCTQETYESVDLFDPIPSLIIQDELHLIRESLGSYDSHYESFLTQFASALSGGMKTPKIIASSATISKFWLQLEQLYLRRGHQFPSAGPKIDESFYAYEDSLERSRLIAGVMPHNKTIIFTVLDILRFYSEIIQGIKKDPQLALAWNIGFVSEEEVLETLEDYRLMLSYNLVKLEGDAITQSIKTMVNPRLSAAGYDEIKYARLTGDVTFSDVKDVLAAVESNNPQEKLDLISATSMISHGVDIDKMNFMVFRGMPRNTAEYIQAYSRAGRRYPGLIIIVLNPTRERDQSHYRYFNKFHEFKDILVEPVPLNRWAKFSVLRTLPGIFCAAILNYLPEKVGKGVKLYMSKSFSNAYNNRSFTDQDILQFVLDSYKCEEGIMEQHFRTVIEEKVKLYIDQILQSDRNMFIPCLISDTPMNSLRDTDIQIEITPNKESFHPMVRVSAGSSRSVE
jgi:hypothetical protein